MPRHAPTATLDKAAPPLYLGIDLGGTNIKFGIVDSDGNTIAYDSIPTDSERGARDAVDRMGRQAHALLADADVAKTDVVAIGLATPGTMDIPAGMILEPPNLGWRHFPIRDALSEAADMKVVFANDANAAGFGEYWIGGGAEFASIVLLTLGTGVGGGIIIDGNTLDGQHSHGGECGHIIVDSSPDARLCGCGQQGHLEAYCSATALIKRAAERIDAGSETQLFRTGELTGLAIKEAAAEGDSLAEELILELAEHLGRGIVTIVHTIDPAAVILGGAMTFGGENDPVGQAFLARVTQVFRDLAFPTLAENTKIRFARLGSDAGYIGAAGIARRAHVEQASG